MPAPQGIPGALLMGNPDIKNFLTPPGEAPEAHRGIPMPVAPTSAAPAMPPPPVQETKEEADVSKLVEDTVTNPPMDANEAYLKELERLKVSQTEAAKIVDAMLFKGAYEEEVQVTKKLRVKLRTRGQEAVDRLNHAIDKADPKYNGSLYGLIAQYNLAASLIAYGPYNFDPSTDEGFEKTVKYIKTLPAPIFQLLCTKLSKFDEKCMAVMTEGAVENFF